MYFNFPYYPQHDSMDCGPACLRMIAAYHGKLLTLQQLREKCYIDREGVSLKGIAEAAEGMGFQTMAVKVNYGKSVSSPCLLSAPLPAIAHWNQNHFVVVYKVNKHFVHIADPASGRHKLRRKDFEHSWCSDGVLGILLLLEKGRAFNESFSNEGYERPISVGFSFLIPYFSPFKRLIFQLILGMLVGSLLQMVFPILTQSIVDIGIDTRDLKFIYLVLLGQLAIFIGQAVVRFIQGWILLHISTRINVNLIGDFLSKLMKLPLGFFDAKHTGDLMQRIGDHYRIESFLTQSLLSIIFSVFNLVVFGILLAIYNTTLFLIFFIAAILYFSYIFIFLKYRREIDYQLFHKSSDNQDNLYEIINGMAEIKLQGSQTKRRWRWAQTQASLFHIRMRSLALSQYQDAGGIAINQLKDILITVVSAQAVIEGKMTLGMMLSVQYIVGQLNIPLQQMIGFIRAAQDAKISLERLGEVHGKNNEEKADTIQMNNIPYDDIRIEGLGFRYTPISDEVLIDVNMTIPKGKVTAIVGSSGSGKTSLVKLLLAFYEASSGQIFIGSIPFSILHKKSWRSKCGAVLQDGYIFSDTIANNIAESDDSPDLNRLEYAVKLANIKEFIDELPLRYNTLIGAKGNGLSMGQKQRILIARAVYKNPDYLFFDEATNSLDAVNESVIVQNLKEFYVGKTVVIVAHRLSTVKDADQIIVLNKGKVIEIGNHINLVQKKGAYYNLVKNQLELGN